MTVIDNKDKDFFTELAKLPSDNLFDINLIKPSTKD
jgi:hypothetical protein